MEQRTLAVKLVGITSLLAAVLLVGRTASAGTTFFDDTFAETDYSQEKVLDTSPSGEATFSASQDADGGNPGPFRHMAMGVTGPGGIAVAHLLTSAVHDPSTQGAIAAIHWSFDARFLAGSKGTSQFGFRLLIRQADSIYLASVAKGFAVAFGPGNGQAGPWTPFSLPGVLPDDFTRFTGGGPAKPDFSASGSPITFGFITTVSESAGLPLTVEGGIDNLRFTASGEGEADLGLTKVAAPSPVEANQELTYTLVVTNKGPATATHVMLVDTLPGGAAFVSASSTQGTCSQVEGVVTCDLGELGAGAEATATIVVLPLEAGSATNQATVTSDAPDPDPGDNTAEVATSVTASGVDLTAEIDGTFGPCSTTEKADICSLSASLELKNSGVPYLAAEVSLTQSCKLPPKMGCKISGTLTLTVEDLGDLPRHSVAFRLSDDPDLDASDPLLRRVKTQVVQKALAKGRPVKLKLKVPSRIEVGGKYIILVVDSEDDVPETNESNNADAFGPLP